MGPDHPVLRGRPAGPRHRRLRRLAGQRKRPHRPGARRPDRRPQGLPQDQQGLHRRAQPRLGSAEVRPDHRQPPVAGNHNQNWQRCLGDVYTAPIATEHALHAMEHGSVWITYQPNLPADQVEALAKKVRGKDYMMMSPYEGQAKPISLQAWGFQLQVDKASDGRIDEFIKALRQNASLEPGTPCSSGDIITETGTVPRDLGKDGTQQQQTGG
ncbi:DUF3105 domain-containing protein [Dactylosporangium cerinum]